MSFKKTAAPKAVKNVKNPKATNKQQVEAKHSHKELEQQIVALKKEIKEALTAVDRLSSETAALRDQVANLSSSSSDSIVNTLVDSLKSHGSLPLRKALRAKGI